MGVDVEGAGRTRWMGMLNAVRQNLWPHALHIHLSVSFKATRVCSDALFTIAGIDVFYATLHALTSRCYLLGGGGGCIRHEVSLVALAALEKVQSVPSTLVGCFYIWGRIYGASNLASGADADRDIDLIA